MIEPSYQTLAGVFLSLVFIAPIAAGYVFGIIEERTDLFESPEDIQQ